MATRLALMSITLAIASIIIAVNPFRLLISNGAHGAEKQMLTEVEVIPVDGAAGPESLAFGPDGEGPYTGVSDGRILQWRGLGRGWHEIAVSAHICRPLSLSSPKKREYCSGSHGSRREHVCGRPLGLQFNHKTGDLYVADAYMGLLAVRADGNLTKVIATEAQGRPFGLTNGLDIDQDTGLVYFTDSSTRFQRREFILAVLTGDRTGRVMRYDPATGELHVLLDGLSFPNGVALSKDGSFLLVVETIPCRVLRYWLRTPRAGSVEVFAHLPGFPDNIKRSPRGGFWVALHSKRSKILKWVLPIPRLGEVLRRVPLDIERLSYTILKWRSQASALRLGDEGHVLEVLDAVGGRGLRYISEIEERDGTLWMGSVVMPHVGLYKL